MVSIEQYHVLGCHSEVWVHCPTCHTLSEPCVNTQPYLSSPVIPSEYTTLPVIPSEYTTLPVIPSEYTALPVILSEYTTLPVIPSEYTALPVILSEYTAYLSYPSKYTALPVILSEYTALPVISSYRVNTLPYLSCPVYHIWWRDTDVWIHTVLPTIPSHSDVWIDHPTCPPQSYQSPYLSSSHTDVWIHRPACYTQYTMYDRCVRFMQKQKLFSNCFFNLCVLLSQPLWGTRQNALDESPPSPHAIFCLRALHPIRPIFICGHNTASYLAY